MSNVKTVRVGQMPGVIKEVAVEVGATIKSVVELAGLNPKGFEIQVNGGSVSLDAKVTTSTDLVLLVKKIKGNANGTVRVGQMPGLIKEVAAPAGTTVKEIISLAGLSATGMDVQIDGQAGTLSSTITNDTNLILLVKKIKGNK